MSETTDPEEIMAAYRKVGNISIGRLMRLTLVSETERDSLYLRLLHVLNLALAPGSPIEASPEFPDAVVRRGECCIEVIGRIAGQCAAMLVGTLVVTKGPFNPIKIEVIDILGDRASCFDDTVRTMHAQLAQQTQGPGLN